MLKLGIIGVGNIGSGHVERVNEGACPNIVITAVADRRASRREWAKEHLPEAQIFVEGSDMIKSGACEAVLIATPHYQHPTLAQEAFKAGLHVLCEKPAGVYTLQVRDMIAEADKHPELTFAMMFNQRTNCVYRKMKEMIDGGEIGEIKRMNWIVTDWYRTQHYYDSGAWRATWKGEGGGVLLNQCPHQLDLLQWLCGLPAKVHAFAHEGKWHDVEVEDDVTAYLEFPNGATGVFITTTGDAPGTNRLEVTGTKGTLTYDQALKLIATALAEKEPAKSGEHWASGYLTLAKERKWLEGDVDLDKPITRLALCQIAAKAQYLTDQPSKNPFTDTKDKGVLSLVEFKIINGMTETTFEPDGLLTRAQIAKIIWSMIGV